LSGQALTPGERKRDHQQARCSFCFWAVFCRLNMARIPGTGNRDIALTWSGQAPRRQSNLACREPPWSVLLLCHSYCCGRLQPFKRRNRAKPALAGMAPWTTAPQLSLFDTPMSQTWISRRTTRGHLFGIHMLYSSISDNPRPKFFWPQGIFFASVRGCD
jgi:hypothetical protein